MRFVQRLLSVGGLALALGGGGLSVGLADEELDLPIFTHGANPAPVPLFPFPSSSVPDSIPNTPTHDNWFLTYRDIAANNPLPRLDSPVSACAYYKAIGAVRTIGATPACGPNGELGNPITFEMWKQMVGIGKYAPDPKHQRDDVPHEDVAHFINKVDLNLTRDHHMISYAPTQLAGYVCNHNGPSPTDEDPSGYFPSQHEIDALIKDIGRKQNKHLIACVAMEYSVNVEYHYPDPLPKGTPFTKFWIFGPDGSLLSTINLDGRGEKGVPHVCTACHGGPFNGEILDTTTGTTHFNPTSNGDLGAHFLPFDQANFSFSSKLSTAEQEEAIFRMNRNVYNTEVTRSGPPESSTASLSIKQLIEGWYGGVPLNVTSPHFHYDYLPTAWDSDQNHRDAYRNAVAHSCRTCHVAMDGQAFELFPGNVNSVPVCTHIMPNSKVTFDRFWLSASINVKGQPAEAVVPGQLSLANPQQPQHLALLFPNILISPCAVPVP